VERIAQAAGTISYALMCGITARVKVEVAEPSEPSGDPQSDLAQ
jgi:hypothetical protein